MIQDGKEVVDLELPLALTGAEGTTLRTRVVGEPRGTKAERIKAKIADLGGPAFEVIDAKTVTMHDPEKGVLVFHAR